MTGFLVVTDSEPLITLAMTGALDALFLPCAAVIIPDMVRYDIDQDLSMPGAAVVGDWICRNEPDRLTVESTEVYEEFLVLRAVNPATKIKNRCEQAAAEVVNRKLEEPCLGVVLLFGDSAIQNAIFLTRVPESVVVVSTSEFLAESVSLLLGKY